MGNQDARKHFMQNDIPKLKGRDLVNHIIDLMMVSDDMEEAVKEPNVRSAWRLLFLSMTLFIIFSSILLIIRPALINNNLISDIILTYYYRLYCIIAILIVIIILFLVTFRHYKYLIKTSRDNSFDTIITFYISYMILFGLLYSNIYKFAPFLFSMKTPYFTPPKVMAVITINSFLCNLEFIIYSACIIFPVNYPRIESNSMIISLLNSIEVIVGIILISIFISTFVQKTNK